MYLNELLIRLLPAEDAHPALFEHYVATLPALAEHRPLEPLLRAFEWRLLDELGYGFALDIDIAGQPIDAQRLYRLVPDAGLEPVVGFQRGCSMARNFSRWPRPTGRCRARWPPPSG